MHGLTKLIREDCVPSLGVTEPGAIALATATARQYAPGTVKKISVSMTSGLYKNAFTCGIPNTAETGILYSAALGVLAGNPQKGLLALEGITPADVAAAREWISQGKVTACLSEVTSNLHLVAEVETDCHKAQVVIAHSHANIVSIVADGTTIFENMEQIKTQSVSEEDITQYTLADFVAYCDTVDVEEIAWIKDSYEMNLILAQAGFDCDRAPITKALIAQNGGKVFSQNPQATARVLTGAAIEARVIGLDFPAMSITGSGSHGIICTMPLYAYYKREKIDSQLLYRATALSYLITMYIKAYSGKLSAYCGCGIAAGTGMAGALAYLQGGNLEQISGVISNMASGITGMICDGGNTGCVLKALTALDAAIQAVQLGLDGVFIGAQHGINGSTPEETMQNMGKIADPGMRETERTIVEILERKKPLPW